MEPFKQKSVDILNEIDPWYVPHDEKFYVVVIRFTDGACALQLIKTPNGDDAATLAAIANLEGNMLIKFKDARTIELDEIEKYSERESMNMIREAVGL